MAAAIHTTDITELQIGQRFGSWKITCPESADAHGSQRRFHCRCDCGYSRLITERQLNGRRVITCAECHLQSRMKATERFRVDGLPKKPDQLGKRYFAKIVENARARGIAVCVTLEQVIELFDRQSRKCALTGYDLFISADGFNQTASLDRIDSSKPYTIDNLQWTHRTVNRMKVDLDQDEFIRMCKAVADHCR